MSCRRPGRVQSALTRLELPAGPDQDYQVQVGLFRESGRAERVGEDFGLLVAGSRFLAFHASTWNGVS